MSTVTFYGRPGCHLCDDAMVIIERVRARQPFRLEVVDIESDNALLLAYLERIPVVAVDGEERFEFFVDEAALSSAIANLSPPAADPPPS